MKQICKIVEFLESYRASFCWEVKSQVCTSTTMAELGHESSESDSRTSSSLHPSSVCNDPAEPPAWVCDKVQDLRDQKRSKGVLAKGFYRWRKVGKRNHNAKRKRHTEFRMVTCAIAGKWIMRPEIKGGGKVETWSGRIRKRGSS